MVIDGPVWLCASQKADYVDHSYSFILRYLYTDSEEKEASKAAVTGGGATQRHPKTRREATEVEPASPGCWTNKTPGLQVCKTAA